MKIRNCGSGTIARSADSPAGGVHPANHEILYITAGKVRFRWTGNVCEAEAPAVFVISPTTPHQLESLVPESKYRYLELMDLESSPLNGEQTDEWNFLQSRKDIYSKMLLAAEILHAFDFVYHLSVSGIGRQHPNMEKVCSLEVEKTYRLIAHALESNRITVNPGGPARKRESREAVNLLIDYMDWRYKENLTLEALAGLVDLNPSYLIRKFKKQTGTTPFEYLRDLRLKAAVNYLSGSQMPIGAIVEQTGFNSVHYFSRLFKQVYGQSPAQWRKQLKMKKNRNSSL
jgi:AraC-like DNA-binding protein